MNNNDYCSNEYMRAIAIRAMRFLPTMEANQWNMLVEFATTSKSVIERLMATETWLYLSDKYYDFQTKNHIKLLIKALDSEPPPTTRLKANYILLLGLYAPEFLEEISIDSDDYLLEEALNMTEEEDSIEELFSHDEPTIIRRKYYSRKNPFNNEALPSG